jgi:hypothetical protein
MKEATTTCVEGIPHAPHCCHTCTHTKQDFLFSGYEHERLPPYSRKISKAEVNKDEFVRCEECNKHNIAIKFMTLFFFKLNSSALSE